MYNVRTPFFLRYGREELRMARMSAAKSLARSGVQILARLMYEVQENELRRIHTYKTVLLEGVWLPIQSNAGLILVGHGEGLEADASEEGQS